MRISLYLLFRPVACLVSIALATTAIAQAPQGATFGSTSDARGPESYDVLAKAAILATSDAARFSSGELQTYRGSFDDRLGLPMFLSASSATPKLASSLLINTDIAGVARQYMKSLANVYRISPAEIDALPVFSTQRLPNGAAIVQFKHLVNGIEVFRERVSVLLNADGSLGSVGGHVSGADSLISHHSAPLFHRTPTDAVATAMRDFGGDYGVVKSSLTAMDDHAGYTQFSLPKPKTGPTLALPARTKPVFFRTPTGLVPAYYVEVAVTGGDTKGFNYYAYVISAKDGGTLFRKNLAADAQAYSYRVWAEPASPYLPLPGPPGRNDTPNPTAQPDGYQAPFVAPNLITLQNGPISTNDPWLPDDATVTTGNNADAYADLTPPFGYNDGDVRPDTVSSNSFDRVFDPNQPPNSTLDQTKAAVTHAFYMMNWLHDWFYDSGFNEADGNAQLDNYGRGGLDGDPIEVHGEYYGCADNASMYPPADGSSPHLFLCQAADNFAADAARVMTAPDVVDTTQTGFATWGPTSFNFSANLVYADPPDACAPLTNAAAMEGAIALIDVNQSPSGCFYMPQAAAAEAAGAIGVLFANTMPGVNGMGNLGSPVSTLPALMISQADGDAIKAALLNGAVTVTLEEVAGPLRDVAVDDTVVSHEWGHYLSNRLIFDSAGLSTNQSGGMGEGWSDFVGALLVMVKSEDQYVASDPAFSGTYAEGAFWFSGMATDWVPPNTQYYYGVRRYPYSTDFAKNPLTYKYVTTGVALPDSPTPRLLFSGTDNAEVHSTGEVWGSMMWECYASLLRDSARLSFTEAQDRMKRYLVGGYKLTPFAPTFVEARDALLSVIRSQDVTDYALCAAGFAKRGLGAGAQPPTDRYGTDNAGVVESFSVSAAMEYAGADLSVIAATDCDGDGVLDNNEIGNVTIQLRNSGFQALTNTTLTLNSPDPTVSFPQTTVAFPAIDPLAVRALTLPVHVQGLNGIAVITINASASDPALTSAISGSSQFRVNTDTVPSQTDGFESTTLAWTPLLEEFTDPTLNWHRLELDPLTHDVLGPDAGEPGVTWLESPALFVSSTGSFGFTFSHRHSFESYPDDVDPNKYDGGVIEISSDGGTTWTDIVAAGGLLTPAYNGTLAVYDGNYNPLEGRAAYVGENPSWPDFDTVTADLGTSFAGQTVQTRFGVGADNGGGSYGWEIDNVSITGIDNQPFAAVVADPGHCVINDTVFANGFE